MFTKKNKNLIDSPNKPFTVPGGYKHILLWLTLLFMMLGLLWAHWAIIDEVTQAKGSVIPSQKVQVIQNLEGGIIKKIHIKEGELVEKGQVVMLIDDTRFLSEYRETDSQIITLEATIARLTAEINNLPFAPSPSLIEKAPELVENELALYQSHINELMILKNRRELLEKEIAMTAPLVKAGAVSEVELLHLKQKVNEIEGAIVNFYSTAQNKLNEAKADMSRLQEIKQAKQDRVERTQVRSPIQGIVKQIHVNTVGGVIQPGMNLIEIVPYDDTLLIKAQVRPQDIGFLHLNQSAVVKISAYDYSIYGGLDGFVEYISADTNLNDEGDSYYEVWVRTQRNYLIYRGAHLPIIPGMQVTINILTGQKTVLDYLLKPILKAKHSALRER